MPENPGSYRHVELRQSRVCNGSEVPEELGSCRQPKLLQSRKVLGEKEIQCLNELNWYRSQLMKWRLAFCLQHCYDVTPTRWTDLLEPKWLEPKWLEPNGYGVALQLEAPR